MDKLHADAVQRIAAAARRARLASVPVQSTGEHDAAAKLPRQRDARGRFAKVAQ